MATVRRPAGPVTGPGPQELNPDQAASPARGEPAETSLSVSEHNTVDPGPLEVSAAYTDVDGTPIRGATVTVTGDSMRLPILLERQETEEYKGVLDVPPDSNGMRSTVQVTAHKPGFATKTAYIGFFTGDGTWIVRNDNVERRLLSWSSDHPRYVGLDRYSTYEGYPTYAVTLTDSEIADAGKLKVMFVQSHAHEPGGTAALMDAANQLLTGETQEGDATTLDRERILREMLLVIVPIGNASGRERCPVQYWEEHFDRETMSCYIYGRLAGATTRLEPSPSVMRRGEYDLDPTLPIPLRYEQVEENTFVEPFFAMVPFVPGKPRGTLSRLGTAT